VNILVVLREFPSLLIICLATQLNNVWYDVSDAATNKIKQAMVTFKDCSQMGDCSSVPGFNFCGPQPNATSLASLYDDLILHFNFITQYNSGIKGIYPAKVLQLVTNLTLAATSDGAVARIPFDVASGSYAPNQTTQCLDWQNPNMTSSVLGEASAAWSVIQWQYLNAPTKAIPEGTVLPAAYTTGRLDCPLSWEWQGDVYNHTLDWFAVHYELNVDNLNKVERLLIINGDYDPTSAKSIRELALSSNRNHSRVINVSGMSHTEASYPMHIFPQGLRPGVDAVSS
jgi:hypothetical protein